MASAILEEDVRASTLADSPAASKALPEGPATVFWIVLAAFVVRVAFLFLAKTYRYDRSADLVTANEITNIAISIVKGRGFSRPFVDGYTLPTAWVAPAYPYFVALVFRLFGNMTRASITFVLMIQGLFSALTVVPILGIARRTVGRRAGLCAAWAWALFPWFAKWSVTWIWDMSLSALLLSLLLWYALRLPDMPSNRTWLGFGALCGLALLVNPALLTFIPVALAWCGFELHRRKQEWLKPAVISMLVCATVISPWLVRNRAVFGQWVFLRSNFGFEFALGNYHGSLGRGWGGRHPTGNPTELQKYEQMGEIGYVQAKQAQAVQFVMRMPREFLTLTALRILYFWDGSDLDYTAPIQWYWMPFSFEVISFLLLPALLVAHRRNVTGWQMFFGVLVLYPIPYYLTFSQVRYRHAIEPLILLLISLAVVEFSSRAASLLHTR